ncbi:RICIN domain-containing protein [Streptomyces sp. NPDC093085]|uniref:RICIN domain-containing protein n=1 Tax=Streptomyces sp. NPDC093085 TaxID=3155068 RepID=UPI00343396C4
MAVLMARHWEAVHGYAAVCLASPAQSASVVAAATFRQVFETLGRAGAPIALRPQLLVTTGDMVRSWSTAEPIKELLPELRKPVVARGIRAARVRGADHRKLAVRSFRAMSVTAQCLLWHTEVEAEPISVPAALLALDTETAQADLEQAREEFRRGCLRAHVEMAPKPECRYYNRLLDVPIRRGGALLPDVRNHLAVCPHCRDAADQLAHFNGKLNVLLAEAVLGWGARRYLDLRAATARTPDPEAVRPVRPTGRHSAPTRRRVRPAAAALNHLTSLPPVPSRLLLASLGAGSVAVLATALAVSLWPGTPAREDYGAAASSSASTPDPAHSGSAGAGHRIPADPTGMATDAPNLRLRNAAGGLCLDIRDARIRPGAETALAECSSVITQQWSYENDGRLRSAANPELCLNSHAPDGTAFLSRCTTSAARADDIRYDLTIQGALIPRWQETLAMAPASDTPDADLVTRPRDDSPEQRWQPDPITPPPPTTETPQTTNTHPRTPNAPNPLTDPNPLTEPNPLTDPNEKSPPVITR